jgi:hypothetical protein
MASRARLPANAALAGRPGRERRRNEHIEIDVVDGVVALDKDGLRVVAHHAAAEEPVAVLFPGGKVEARGARRAGFAIAPELCVPSGRGLYRVCELILAPAANGDRGPVERAEDHLDQGRLARALRPRRMDVRALDHDLSPPSRTAIAPTLADSVDLRACFLAFRSAFLAADTRARSSMVVTTSGRVLPKRFS